MGFLVTTLIFVVVGVIASFGAGILCNRGPSTNLFVLIFFLGSHMVFDARIGGLRHLLKGGRIPTISPQLMLHLTLIITATVCCWMMWAIVYLAQLKPLIVPVLSEGE